MRNGCQRSNVGQRLAPPPGVQDAIGRVLPWVMLAIVLGLATVALVGLFMFGAKP